MATLDDATPAARIPLSRQRIVRAAVEMADRAGLDAVSMRKVAQELGVDPMSLYNHVTNKRDLLDGMVEQVVSELDPPPTGEDWKATLRARMLAAREAMLRHQWAAAVLHDQAESPPAVIAHFEVVAGILRGGGFSIDLTHHALHVLGSRLLGFSPELFDVSEAVSKGPELLALQAHAMAGQFPNLAEMLLQISHDEATVVGSGCDDQAEFVFAMDLILDGLDRLRAAGH